MQVGPYSSGERASSFIWQQELDEIEEAMRIFSEAEPANDEEGLLFLEKTAEKIDRIEKRYFSFSWENLLRATNHHLFQQSRLYTLQQIIDRQMNYYLEGEESPNNKMILTANKSALFDRVYRTVQGNRSFDRRVVLTRGREKINFHVLTRLFDLSRPYLKRDHHNSLDIIDELLKGGNSETLQQFLESMEEEELVGILQDFWVDKRLQSAEFLQEIDNYFTEDEQKQKRVLQYLQPLQVEENRNVTQAIRLLYTTNTKTSEMWLIEVLCSKLPQHSKIRVMSVLGETILSASHPFIYTKEEFAKNFMHELFAVICLEGDRNTVAALFLSIAARCSPNALEEFASGVKKFQGEGFSRSVRKIAHVFSSSLESSVKIYGKEKKLVLSLIDNLVFERKSLSLLNLLLKSHINETNRIQAAVDCRLCQFLVEAFAENLLSSQEKLKLLLGTIFIRFDEPLLEETLSYLTALYTDPACLQVFLSKEFAQMVYGNGGDYFSTLLSLLALKPADSKSRLLAHTVFASAAEHQGDGFLPDDFEQLQLDSSSNKSRQLFAFYIAIKTGDSVEAMEFLQSVEEDKRLSFRTLLSAFSFSKLFPVYSQVYGAEQALLGVQECDREQYPEVADEAVQLYRELFEGGDPQTALYLFPFLDDRKRQVKHFLFECIGKVEQSSLYSAIADLYFTGEITIEEVQRVWGIDLEAFLRIGIEQESLLQLSAQERGEKIYALIHSYPSGTLEELCHPKNTEEGVQLPIVPMWYLIEAFASQQTLSEEQGEAALRFVLEEFSEQEEFFSIEELAIASTLFEKGSQEVLERELASIIERLEDKANENLHSSFYDLGRYLGMQFVRNSKWDDRMKSLFLWVMQRFGLSQNSYRIELFLLEDTGSGNYKFYADLYKAIVRNCDEDVLFNTLWAVLNFYKNKMQTLPDSVLLSFFEEADVLQVLLGDRFFSLCEDNAFESEDMLHIMSWILTHRPKEVKERIVIESLLYPLMERLEQIGGLQILPSWTNPAVCPFEGQLFHMAQALRSDECKEEKMQFLRQIPQTRRIPLFQLSFSIPFTQLFPFYVEAYGVEETLSQIPSLPENASISVEVGKVALLLAKQGDILPALALCQKSGEKQAEVAEKIIRFAWEHDRWQDLEAEIVPKAVGHAFFQIYTGEDNVRVLSFVSHLIPRIDTVDCIVAVAAKYPAKVEELLQFWETVPSKENYRKGVRALYKQPEELWALLKVVRSRYETACSSFLLENKESAQNVERKLALLNNTAEVLFEVEAGKGAEDFSVLQQFIEGTPLVLDAFLWKYAPNIASQTFRFSLLQAGVCDERGYFTCLEQATNQLCFWQREEKIEKEEFLAYRQMLKAVRKNLSHLRMVSPNRYFEALLPSMLGLSSLLLDVEKAMGDTYLKSRIEKDEECNYTISTNAIYPQFNDEGEFVNEGRLFVSINNDLQSVLCWALENPEENSSRYFLNRYVVLQDPYAHAHFFTLPDEEVSKERWAQYEQRLLSANISPGDRDNLRFVLEPLRFRDGEEAALKRILAQRRKIAMVVQAAVEENVVDELALRLSDAVARCGDGLDQAIEHLIIRFVTKAPEGLGEKIAKLITLHKQRFIEDHGDKRVFLGEEESEYYMESNTMIPRLIKERVRLPWALPGEFVPMHHPECNVYMFAANGMGVVPASYEPAALTERFFNGGVITLDDGVKQCTTEFAPFTKDLFVKMVLEEMQKPTQDPSKIIQRDDINTFLQTYYDEALFKEFEARQDIEETQTNYFTGSLELTERGVERILYLLGYLQKSS